MEKNATADLDEFLQTLNLQTVTGPTRGKEAWHVVMIRNNSETEKAFVENIGGAMDVKDYGAVLDSGWVSKNTKPEAYFLDTLRKELIVRRSADDVWYYFLCTKNKEEFLKDRSLDLEDVEIIRRYGKLLNSVWGRDPPELVAISMLKNFLKQKDTDDGLKSVDTELHEAARKGIVEKFELPLSYHEIICRDKNMWTLLHHASFGGKIPIIKSLLEMNLSVHVEDNFDRKPIHIAAREGFVSVIKLFLENGIGVNDKDSYNWTPLHYAAWGGHLPAVSLLLNESAEINATESWNNAKAIHLAARLGHAAIVEVLLSRGASINDVDGRGRSPLYYAAWRGQMSTVEFLLDRGADLCFRTSQMRLGGKMAVHVAACNGHTQIVMFFIGKENCLLNMQSSEGWTPLRYADYYGSQDTVKFLIDKGASMYTKDAEGTTLLDDDVEERYEYLSLHAAAKKGNLDAVKHFIKAGVGTKHVRTECQTILHSAVLSNEKEVIEFIVKELVTKQGCLHIDVPDKILGQSPLMWAASYGKQDSVQILLESDADINFQSKPHGNTALHLAADKSHLEAVKILVFKDANINLKDSAHLTALHYAVMNRNEAIIKFLIDKDADVDARDIKGKTPLDYAGEMRCLFKSSCSAVSERNSTAVGGDSVAAVVAVVVNESMIDVEERSLTERGEAKLPAKKSNFFARPMEKKYRPWDKIKPLGPPVTSRTAPSVSPWTTPTASCWTTPTASRWTTPTASRWTTPTASPWTTPTASPGAAPTTNLWTGSTATPWSAPTMASSAAPTTSPSTK